jgi:O-acetylhomoserine (thiol)-lyase
VGAGLVVNALTKSIGGHGNALGGSMTDTGAYDWTRFPNIYENYKKAAPLQWGLAQIRAKALRDFGSSLAPDAAHHIAVGAETLALRMQRTTPTRWRWPKCWRRMSALPPSTIRA